MNFMNSFTKILLFFICFTHIDSHNLEIPKLKFPKDFQFGTATAAYQIEGGWLDDNKSMHIWDNIAHSNLTDDKNTGDIAADSYHKFSDDIQLLKENGIKNFRMSISWSRIIPYGRANSQINYKGIEHYLKVFQMMKENGITPYVTLYHWDLPAYLHIIGNGLADPDFPEDFAFYAETCFKFFGHLVKFWFTFNEPWCTTVLTDYYEEDAPKKPYIIAHNILLAHGKAVQIYRNKYQNLQQGKIGIVINSEFYYPKDPKNRQDIDAAYRCLKFQLGWFAEPIFLGDYPQIMKDKAGIFYKKLIKIR